MKTVSFLLIFGSVACVPLHAQTAPGNIHAAQLPPAVADWQKEEPVRAPHAMVVSIHHLAADAGISILKLGGNAVDAAVATGFALAVVHPDAGNLGGGGFMLVHLKTKAIAAADTFIDYRERAPAAATRDMYLDKQDNLIPGASTLGYKAIGVPGSVAGMVYAEAKYGRMGLKAVMATGDRAGDRRLRPDGRRSKVTSRSRPDPLHRVAANLPE